MTVQLGLDSEKKPEEPTVYRAAEPPRPSEAAPPTAGPAPAPAPAPDARHNMDHLETPNDENFKKLRGESLEGWDGKRGRGGKYVPSADAVEIQSILQNFYGTTDRARRTQLFGSLIQIVETSQDGRLQAQALNIMQQLLADPSSLNVERSAIVEGLQTFLRYRPMASDYWIILGRLYREMKEEPLALRTITTIAEIAPDDAAARQRLSLVYLEFGALRQARYEITEVTRLRPEEPEAYFQLGDLLVREGNLTEAEACYRRMLRFNFHERFGDVEARARTGLMAVYRAMVDRKVGDRSELEDKIRRLQAGTLEFKDVKIVLSWKTSGTDVDLWVTPPGEEKCTYQRKSTFRGGRLDRDVTSGFGPETFTLPEFRDGVWLVEVEFYSGGVVTAGQVDIILFEGTEREVKKTVPFTLKESKHKVTIFKGELKDLLEQ
jgi:hypothetical protein